MFRLKLSLTTLLMAMSGCLPVSAESFLATVNGKRMYFNALTENTCEITYFTGSGGVVQTDFYTGDLVIPSTVTRDNTGDEYTVTAIGIQAFKGSSELTSVEIPSSITYIKREAFSGCTGLTTFEIPSNITDIGERIFFNCTNLNTIYYNASNCSMPYPSTWIGEYNDPVSQVIIGEGIESIPRGMFAHSPKNITSVTLPNTVTSIGESAFEYSDVKDITFSTNLRTISNNAFKYSSIQTVNLPNSVETIGKGAFYMSSKLTSVSLGNSLETIGENAFESCQVLTTVDFQNASSLKTIGDGAFIGTNIQTLELPSSLETIGDYAFSQNKSLSSLVLPESLITIGSRAFSWCTNLSSNILIPNSVTTIGASAFYECGPIPVVTIGTGVETIGDYAFASLASLEKVYFNARNCTQMKSSNISSNYAFDKCVTLKEIYIGDEVTIIPSCAFYINANSSEDPQLYLVELGRSVETIEGSAFSGYKNLKIIVNHSNLELELGKSSNGNVAYYASYIGETMPTKDGDFYFADEEKTQLVAYIGHAESVTIPSSTVSVGQYTFQYNNEMTSVLIPSGVTLIGQKIFNECRNLTKIYYNATNCADFEYSTSFSRGYWLQEVIIGENVQTIPAYFMSGCTGLTSIQIPSQVTLIGASAFSGCTGLTSIQIPSQVTSIGERAFSDCSGLEEVNLGSSLETIEKGTFYQCVKLTSVTVPNSVISIGENAFEDCTGLESIKLGSSVETIERDAFYNCSSLLSLEIPNSVTIIKESAFNSCSGLKSIVVGTGVKYLYCDFSGCSSLESITFNATNCELCSFFNASKVTELIFGEGVTIIPAGMTGYFTALKTVTIPSSVVKMGFFNRCTSLKSVIFNASNCEDLTEGCFNSQLEEIIFGENVQRIPAYLLAGCTGLTSLELGNTITTIGKYAFKGCSNLTSVSLPENITAIEENTFYGCTSLSNLTIPNKVTSIGSSSFSGCTSLSNLTIPNKVTSIGSYSFSGCTSLEDIQLPSNLVTIDNSSFTLIPQHYSLTFFIST